MPIGHANFLTHLLEGFLHLSSLIIKKKEDEKFCVFVVSCHLLNSSFDQVGACLLVKWCEKVACLNMKSTCPDNWTGVFSSTVECFFLWVQYSCFPLSSKPTLQQLNMSL